LDVAGIPVPENDGMSLSKEPGEARPWVVLEEHDRAFHPLYPAMKIASDVYELRSPRLRQQFWNGGSECHTSLGDGAWRRVACSSPEAGGGFRTPAFVVRGLAADSKEGSGIPPDQEKKLRALGYLR